MRFLPSCVGASGHLFPTLPLANALGERGHDVVFTSGPDM
jgi:UDP:flavonoid glycosyltransferase YjiC (YdhE family)